MKEKIGGMGEERRIEKIDLTRKERGERRRQGRR